MTDGEEVAVVAGISLRTRACTATSVQHVRSLSSEMGWRPIAFAVWFDKDGKGKSGMGELTGVEMQDAGGQ